MILRRIFLVYDLLLMIIWILFIAYFAYISKSIKYYDFKIKPLRYNLNGYIQFNLKLF